MNNIDFTNIKYLKNGNKKQKEAYNILKAADIFNILKEFNPILVGTIPISIDIDKSDLDIICEVYDMGKFESLATKSFSKYKRFKMNTIKNEESMIKTCNFLVSDIEIEIYAQGVKSKEQNGYRHMIIENRIIELGGDTFRRDIIKLKEEGFKTEPAFAKYLNIEGNPYNELLKLEKYSDKELEKILNNINK